MSEELEDYEVQLNEIIEEIVNSLTKEVAKLSGRLKVEVSHKCILDTDRLHECIYTDDQA